MVSNVTVPIDLTVCTGHALCVALVAEAFIHDETAGQTSARPESEIQQVPTDRLR